MFKMIFKFNVHNVVLNKRYVYQKNKNFSRIFEYSCYENYFVISEVFNNFITETKCKGAFACAEPIFKSHLQNVTSDKRYDFNKNENFSNIYPCHEIFYYIRASLWYIFYLWGKV